MAREMLAGFLEAVLEGLVPEYGDEPMQNSFVPIKITHDPYPAIIEQFGSLAYFLSNFRVS